MENILQQLQISLNSMQLAAVDAIAQTQDVVLLSPTGSGKTMAFLLPLIQKLQTKSQTRALIVVPTRELALQIEQVFRSLRSGLKVTCCYGGHSSQVEDRSLSQQPAVIVGTPGRIAYHIRAHSLTAADLTYLVLDEFDKSLELGFEEEMSFILEELKGLEQKILTSATAMVAFPPFLRLNSYKEINFLSDTESKGDLQCRILRTSSKEKLNTLLQLLAAAGQQSVLIFCNHREVVERLARMMDEQGIWCGVYHGGLEQKEREKVLIKFRNQSLNILVTTDLAARGLDIPEVMWVIHYQIPNNEEAYIHRNGRTARMYAEGTSCLILSDDEYVPPYILSPQEEVLPLQPTSQFSLPAWVTFYVAAGKKDKINKTDIAGLFYKKAALKKEELGRIDVQDFMSYAAVKRTMARKVLASIIHEKIKGKRYKLGIDE